MRRRVIAMMLAALTALAAAGCGSSDEEIPQGAAEELLADLDTLEQQVEAEDCDSADETLTELFNRAGELPGGETKDGVQQLLGRLENQVMDRCSEIESTTTDTTDTTDTTTEPTTTTTEPTEETTTTTTTTEEETTTPTPPNGQGPGGEGPPGQDGGGDEGSGGLAPGGEEGDD